MLPPRVCACEFRGSLVAFARAVVGDQLISERGLTQLALCCQPRLHSVLAGLYECAPEPADALGQALGVTLLDLDTIKEVQARIAESQARQRVRLDAETELAA